jgi:transposase
MQASVSEPSRPAHPSSNRGGTPDDARRAKTDAIDVDGLLRALIAYAGGERGRCRMVRVPSVAEEDAKRTHRERKRLVEERTGHINRIKALLALHGITDYEPIKAGRRQRLHALVTHDGEPLPPRLRRELSRELDCLELVLEQLAEVEAEPRRRHLPDGIASWTAAHFELSRLCRHDRLDQERGARYAA